MPAKPRRTLGQLNLTDLLTEIMQDMLIFAALLLPVELLASSWRLPLYGLVLLVLVLTWLVRLLCRQLWLFVLLHLVLLVLPLLLPILPSLQADLWPRIILLPSLAILLIRSFYLRLRQDRDQTIGELTPQAFVILYFLALNLVAIRFDLDWVSRSYFYLGILYLMLALFRWHRASLISQMERFAGMPSQPAARILRFNQFLLLGFALVMLILLFLSPWLRLHDLLPWLGQILLLGIRWLVRHLQTGAPDETVPEPQPSQEPTDSEPQLPVGPTEPARWLIILQEIFYYLVIILLVLLALALIAYLLYRLYRRFYEHKQPQTDQLEALLPNFAGQTRERLSRVRNRLSQQYGQSPEQRIRRHYYRLIDSQIHKGLRYAANLTPRQIADLLDSERYPELLGMTELYELARYGPGSCSAADAVRMQTLYRSLHRLDLTVHNEKRIL